MGGKDPFTNPPIHNCYENEFYYPPNPDLASEKGEGISIISSDRSFGKIKDWLNDPTMPVDSSNPQPGETISFTSLPSHKKQSLPPGEDLVFKSIAEDRHTKGLTPEKMLEIFQSGTSGIISPAAQTRACASGSDG